MADLYDYATKKANPVEIPLNCWQHHEDSDPRTVPPGTRNHDLSREDLYRIMFCSGPNNPEEDL